MNVKIGSTAFSIEEDAYRALDDYLSNIRARLDDQASAAETMTDLEMRIADLLSNWIGNPDNTVTLYYVRKVQEVIGSPEVFGELKQPSGSTNEEPIKRLARSSTDVVIGGVCGGIAKFVNIDPTLVRIATLLLVIFGGLSLWIYIILWIFLPLETKKQNI